MNIFDGFVTGTAQEPSEGAQAPLPPLTVRQYLVPQSCGHYAAQWYLVAQGRPIAHVPNYAAFMSGWMASDPLHIHVRALSPELLLPS